MPIPGRKPKEGPKQNRNPTLAWTEVPNLPYDGPSPRMPRRKGGWPSEARRKWKIWSAMPHCSLWTDSDWEYALDTLELVARFYEGESARSTEIRNRERVLGTTADYRRDLRIRYVAPDGQDGAEQVQVVGGVGEVTNLDDYRDQDLFG